MYDKDPYFAANLANYIAEYADTLINKIKQNRARQAYELLKEEYNNTMNYLKLIQDTLNYARQMGVFNYKAQSEMYSKAYSEALASQNLIGAKIIEDKLNVLKKYGGIYQMFDEILTYEAKRVSELNQKLLKTKIDAYDFISYKFIVSKASPPEKEYYPIYWLIILGGTFSTTILFIFIIAFYEKTKIIKKTYYE